MIEINSDIKRIIRENTWVEMDSAKVYGIDVAAREIMKYFAELLASAMEEDGIDL